MAKRKTKATKVSKKARKAPKTPATVPTATERKENGKKAIKKETGICSAGLTVVNEAVGLHFRVAKAVLDSGEQAPLEGDLVMAKVDGHEIPLMIRHTQPCVNGDVFVQAFLVEKGSGHHEILGAAKGKMAQVTWE